MNKIQDIHMSANVSFNRAANGPRVPDTELARAVGRAAKRDFGFRLSCFHACLLLVSSFILAPSSFSSEADLGGFRDAVKPFITRHCTDCHGADDPEAKLSLHAINGDVLAGKDIETWKKIAERLVLAEMPPEDEPRPDAVETAKVVACGRYIEYPYWGNDGHRETGNLYTTFLSVVGEKRDYFGIHDPMLKGNATGDGPLDELLV